MPKIKSRRQLRADRKRVENQKDREQELLQLKKNADRLKSMSSGLIKGVSTGRTTGAKIQVSALPSSGVLSQKAFRRETPNYPSLVSVSSSPVKVKKPLSEEMQRREEVAQLEIERKKKRVAVICHKSGYQYLSEDTDLTMLGKKQL